MTLWRFVDQPGFANLAWDVGRSSEFRWLVLLLGLVGAYSLFAAGQRCEKRADPYGRHIWVAVGAIAAGAGFWGMEWVAILRLETLEVVGIDPAIRLVSLIPAVAGCAACLWYLTTPAQIFARLPIAALAVTLGIGTSHYVAMEALIFRANLGYVFSTFALSFGEGYAFALLAFYGSSMLQRRWRTPEIARWAGSCFLGFGALGIHYTGVTASFLYGTPTTTVIQRVPPTLLVPVISSSVLLVIGAIWLCSLIDARLSAVISKLQNSEARYRAAIDTMVDGHVITDQHGRIQGFNGAAQRLFGYSPDEVVGRHVSILVANPEHAAESNRWSADGPPVPLGRQLLFPAGGRRKDGSTFPVEVCVQPFSAGSQQLYSGIICDLTEQHAAESRTKRLLAAMDQAGEAIAILDATRAVVYVNPQYERHWGFSQEEVIGKRPFGGAGDPPVYAGLWDTVAKGEIWRGQGVSRHREGWPIDEEISVTPIVEEGQVSAYVAVMRDVSQRVFAERERQQLIEALEQAADSIAILDDVGRVTYVNRAYEIRNHVALVEIRGLPFAASKWIDQEDESVYALLDSVRAGKAWNGVVQRLSSEGRLLKEEVTVTPIRDPSRTVLSSIVVSRDVTEKMTLENQLRQAQKLESIGQLAAGIAHEINTPTQYVGDNLSFLESSFQEVIEVLGSLRRLEEDPASLTPAVLTAALGSADIDYLHQEIPLALKQSREGVKRVAGIVRAMNDFSHPGQSREAIDLNRAITSTITVATGEWKYVATIKTDLDPSLPVVVCLPAELNQVILNMLVNAAHAIEEIVPRGSAELGCITVSTRNLGQWVEIRIADTGAGIAPEIRDRIFDPFFTTKEVGKGTGQGLAMAHHTIVNQHGGSISVESEVGRGTCFILRLPIAQAASATNRVA